jgi:hypothetical protein
MKIIIKRKQLRSVLSFISTSKQQQKEEERKYARVSCKTATESIRNSGDGIRSVINQTAYETVAVSV